MTVTTLKTIIMMNKTIILLKTVINFGNGDHDDDEYDDDNYYLKWVPPHQLGVRLKIPHEGTSV